MKTGIFFAALAVLAISSFAHADITASGYASLGETVYLAGCGGTMTFNNGAYDNQINVVFSNIQNCSNFDIIGDDNSYVADYNAKKLDGANTNRYGSFTIPAEYINYGRNTVTVQIRSNSGRHSDTIKVRYNKRFTVNVNSTPTDLSSCGGTITVTNGYQDNKIYMNFNDVTQCSNFDLIGDDYRAVADYTAKKLAGPNGDRYRTFEIPADRIHYGTNTLTATVYSNSHRHQDVVSVTYTAGYTIQ